MAYTLAVGYHKGGVGKTTTTLDLGGELARMGKRVLLIDLDAQMNLTVRLQVRAAEPTLAQVLTAPRGTTYYDCAPTALACAWRPENDGEVAFAVVPGDPAMAGVELALVGMVSGRERRLARALASLQDEYDYILIDCPPSLSLLMVNALYAADGVLLPVQAQTAAYQMLPWTLDMIANVRDEGHPVEVFGFVVTMRDHTGIAREVEELLRSQYGGQVFQTTIPRLVELAEDSQWQAPVGVYAPRGRGTQAYAALAKEVISRASA